MMRTASFFHFGHYSIVSVMAYRIARSYVGILAEGHWDLLPELEREPDRRLYHRLRVR